MKTQQIISELKELLNRSEVINGFKTQADCLAWSNKVASLLQFTKEHHAFFMERLNILNVSGLSADLYASTFRIMVSLANQGLFELEHNMPSDVELSIPKKKEWHEKPWGLIIIGVIIVILGFFFTQPIYDYIKTRLYKEQQQPPGIVLPNGPNIPKKIPSSPPIPNK